MLCCMPKKRKVTNKNEIKTMPHYFANQKTKVKFISQQKLNKIKTFSHKGQVVTPNNMLNFSLNLKSNPEFTAKVLIAYSKSFYHLRKNKNYGAFTIFDIPLSYILKEDKFTYL